MALFGKLNCCSRFGTKALAVFPGMLGLEVIYLLPSNKWTLWDTCASVDNESNVKDGT